MNYASSEIDFRIPGCLSHLRLHHRERETAPMVDFPNSSTPLYDRLGGSMTIQLTVEKFCERVSDDDKLAVIHESIAGEKAVKRLIGEAIALVQNPQLYLEALSQKVSKPLLDESRFERCISHLIAAMVWASVPRNLMEEVVELVTLLADVLVKRAEASE